MNDQSKFSRSTDESLSPQRDESSEIKQLRAENAALRQQLSDILPPAKANTSSETAGGFGEMGRLQLALDAADLATWQWLPDRDELRLDAKLKALWGVEDWPDVISSATFFELVHPEDHAMINEILAHAVSRKTTKTPEFRLIRPKTGDTIWLGIRGRVFLDDEGRKHIFGVTYDTTAENEALLALRNSEQRLKLALEAAHMGTWQWHPESDEIIWNARQYEIFGMKDPTQKMTSASVLAMIHPDDDTVVRDVHAKAAMGQEVFNPRFRVKRKDNGRTVWLQTRGAPFIDAEGRRQLFGVSYDITTERRARAILLDTVDWQKAIFNGTLDGILVLNAKMRVHAANPAAMALFGHSEHTIPQTELARLMPDLYDPGSSISLADILSSNTEEGVTRIFELTGLRRNGEAFPLELTMGEITSFGKHYYVGAVRDISERKRSAERQRMLIGELDHRVKNILARFDAVVDRSMEQATDLAGYANALKGRIASMARTHSLLSHEQWTGANLVQIIQDELIPYAAPKNIVIEGEGLILTADAAQAVSMTLHELATNAAKYGALSVAHGKVRVTLTRGADLAGKSTIVINWRETGGPQVQHPARSGYGTSVIRNMMSYETDANVTLDFLPEGLNCRIEAHINRLSPAVRALSG